MTNLPLSNTPIRTHIGVYGIHLDKNKGQVLLILKGRGPYKGMYDLPGGGIEEKETREHALNREYQEEIGTEILSHTFLYEDYYEFPYISQTEGEVTFQHTGYFYEVTLPKDVEIKKEPDGHDSMGAIYVSVSDILEQKAVVAPMARKAILSVLDVVS